MTKEIDPIRLSSPQVFLWRMIIFLVIAGFIALILYRHLAGAFMSNPGLNGLIVGVLFVGIILVFIQVVRLFPEVRWVNDYRMADPGLALNNQPVLLAPMATILGDRVGRVMISTQTMRSILDSIGMRLDESRDISRYLTGLLVFLGLLGTFWGLTQTVGSIGETIKSLSVGNDVGVVFEDLKSGLAAPLAGMATAFSSSLFGLAGSLVLGFLDLQAGQAQNRFYTDLEDWLSTVTDLTPDEIEGHISARDATAGDLRHAIEHLTHSLQTGGGGRQSTGAMANLAEAIQGLVQHMRSEQQMIRSWVEGQAEEQTRIRDALEKLGSAPAPKTPPAEGPSGHEGA
ncbi:MAG TPA: flagellar motor protein MotA [Hyphomicrobiales bacterium]|nr:flagellar motor protein MotA [Hyphomicrobiales bacterium]